jgi:hypothetical protein
MNRQAGKYNEARKNWILIVSIHLIVFVMSSILYFSLSDVASGLFRWMTIAATFSLLLNVAAYKLYPHWYRNKNNSIED